MKAKVESWKVDSEDTKSSLHRFIDEAYAEKKCITFTLTTERRPTVQQFNALHLWCERLATALNDAGLDMRKMLKESIQIPWTKTTVKNELWRPIQIIVCGAESTKDPAPHEYVEIYDILNRHLSEKKGIHVAWPEKDINEK